MANRPIIIGVGGLSSEVGKTTLMCELLRACPGSEAIKTTRGHYRSCGKDPHACCVSDMLEDAAVVRSERELTDVPGKDTGRYWSAGASNVHWVIATDEQVAQGVQEALTRVRAPRVFVEGNSFALTIEPDFFVMVARPDREMIKSTARQVLSNASAVFVSGTSGSTNKSRMQEFLRQFGFDQTKPLFSSDEINALAMEIVSSQTLRET